MPTENETPRASRSRPLPNSVNTAKNQESVDGPKHLINRNGSVMKLAQNFTAITQVGGDPITPSFPCVSPITPANTAILTTPESCQQWSSGEILNRHLDHLKIPLTGRPSVQKIRSENLGKVSAHVRKFDRLASPTLPDPRVVLNPNVTPKSVSTDSTPVVSHRVRSPRKCSHTISRQLSDPQGVKERSTPPKISQISPLRESQRANALPQSAKGQERCDVKVKLLLDLYQMNLLTLLCFIVV